ncbi:MAG: putative esterase of the alpha-beta hydrolase superfamily, partial [Frankiales bacterium]|nr:putative esterase of the alpha-beta hydrolase superfamily [Frankiales bacterium]
LQVGRRGVRPGSVAAGLLPAGRQSTEGISRPLRQVFGDAWPDRDLRVCAVRVRDARRVVFGTGDAPVVDVATAVAASCAIPAYFAPVQVGADRYVDGGVHSPTNADVLLPDRLDLVLVLSPMTLAKGAGRPADLPLRLAVGRYLATEVRRLRRSGTRVVVVQPTARDLAVMGTNPMAGARARDVVGTVAGSVRARLERQGTLAAALG